MKLTEFLNKDKLEKEEYVGFGESFQELQQCVEDESEKCPNDQSFHEFLNWMAE